MNTPLTLLSADNISILRGQQAIIRHASITLSAGQAIHLLGENGSGKTTLLQALAGILPISAGSITRHSPLLYLGHKAGIKALLTVEENLSLAAKLYHGMSAAESQSAIQHALTQMGIAHLAQRQARYLSAGQQRRVQLARLWLPCPTLWLLDEPLTALDIQTSQMLGAHCAQHIQAGGAILLTSHQAFPLPTQLQHLNLQDLIKPSDTRAQAEIDDWEESSF